MKRWDFSAFRNDVESEWRKLYVRLFQVVFGAVKEKKSLAEGFGWKHVVQSESDKKLANS